MKDIVIIERLSADTIIGVYDRERNVRQKVVVDIELHTDIAKPAETDCIDDALDYKALSDRITSFIEESTFLLIEALAEKIAAIILAEFPVDRVRIKLSKPGAIDNAANVSILLERGNQ